jgi:sugar lactone lactonase YvrE
MKRVRTPAAIEPDSGQRQKRITKSPNLGLFFIVKGASIERKQLTFLMAIERFSTALTLIGALGLLGLGPASDPDAPLRASLVAGSGAIGFADGPADRASFMMPTAMAYGSDGTLYVTDQAAQRVRAISPLGTVTTLAGSGEINASGMWVDGGYADGPAATARFDRPDGIAVGSDGTVYVSDLGNGCIRAIAHGVVRTFARGLTSPRGLFLDKDGTMYVADWAKGVAIVDREGASHPVTPGGATIDRATTVYVGHSGPKIATLFIGEAAGLLEIGLPSLQAHLTPAFQDPSEAGGSAPVEGDFPFGVPFAVAAYDVSEAVYADVRDSSVKYFRLHTFVRFLGQAPPEDAPLHGGASDSAEGFARFDSPMGIAIDPSGSVVVADTGNRRIVRLAEFDRGMPITPDQFSKLQFAPNHYRIALVGSSYSWFFSSVPSSIAGRLASDLAAVPALANRPPAAKYFQIGRLTGEFDLVDNVLAEGAADLVVFLVSPVDPYGLGLGSEPAKWTPLVRGRFQASAAALKAAHIPFVVAIVPAPQTLSPLESTYLFQVKEPNEATDYESQHAAMVAALAGLNIPTLDLYPAFRAEIASPAHRPLYITGDVHLTEHGRELAASEIARYLEGLSPWNK